jgi:Chaperone of endosialidase
MNSKIQFKTVIRPILTRLHRYAKHCWQVTLVLACFGLLPEMQAVSPAPDGCYPNYTTAEGCSALNALSSGVGNTAIGWYSLLSDTNGSYNTGVGAGTLLLNTSSSNTAVGAAALLLNTTGDENTASGSSALEQNRKASLNTALGAFAAMNNDSSGNGTAEFNTAVGGGALEVNVDGADNTAVGGEALQLGHGGNENTAVGVIAGYSISGNFNTCLGSSAGSDLTSGEGNIYIGAHVEPGTTGEREFTRIGDDHAFARPYDTFIAGIYGRSAGPSPLTVMCGSDGKLSANASSRRFKHDIKPMDNVSEAILALKPVTFRYNNDSTNTPWYGLIAEDVAKVSEDLIVRDKEGKPFGVRYEEVNAMLLNEFLKEHKKVDEQQASISQLKSEMQTMVAQLKEQAAQIQKVSAQVEVSKRMAQVAASSP